MSGWGAPSLMELGQNIRQIEALAKESAYITYLDKSTNKTSIKISSLW